MLDQYSVVAKDVDKSYGKTQVLKKLCMKVEKGQIYGLLGSSGCGKTALLSTIAGRKKIDAGEIWVLGGKPGSPESGVPGRNIGYMPQEVALIGEFTVKDIIFYFGRIYNLKDEVIQERYEELVALLDLPPDNKFIKDCSGGQQRRISFAVAVAHRPKLVILDEPTVGIDPLLRARIWSHIIEIAAQEQLSIIITTHYIEECRQAHKIGLMRGGRLLVEDSPNSLLSRFNTDTLEEVFLILSQEQQAELLEKQNTSESSKTDEQNVYFDATKSTISLQSVPEEHKSTDILINKSNPKRGFMNRRRMGALYDKNFKQFYRNPMAIISQISFPIFQMVILIVSVGLPMKDIPIGIVNDESKSTFCSNSSFYVQTDNETLDCHLYNISCRFLMHHLSDPMINKIDYNSLETAIEDVKHGKLYGVLYIPEKFSESLAHRIGADSDSHISDDILEFSTIKVRMDMSNAQIGENVRAKLILKYNDFQTEIYKDCNYLDGYGDSPLKPEYLYGSIDDPYQDFIIPGNIVTMMFYLGAMMTCLVMVLEKQEGIWDRSIVAGVNSLELIISHLTFQAVILIFEVVETFILIYFIYRFEYVGSIVLMYALVYFQALCGMTFGLLISILSSNFNGALNASMGFIFPLNVLCGNIWPMEAMPQTLQMFTLFLPNNLAIKAFYAVIKKGVSIDTWIVAGGFGVSIAWSMIFTLTGLCILRLQR